MRGSKSTAHVAGRARDARPSRPVRELTDAICRQPLLLLRIVDAELADRALDRDFGAGEALVRGCAARIQSVPFWNKQEMRRG